MIFFYIIVSIVFLIIISSLFTDLTLDKVINKPKIFTQENLKSDKDKDKFYEYLDKNLVKLYLNDKYTYKKNKEIFLQYNNIKYGGGRRSNVVNRLFKKIKLLDILAKNINDVDINDKELNEINSILTKQEKDLLEFQEHVNKYNEISEKVNKKIEKIDKDKFIKEFNEKIFKKSMKEILEDLEILKTFGKDDSKLINDFMFLENYQRENFLEDDLINIFEKLDKNANQHVKYNKVKEDYEKIKKYRNALEELEKLKPECKNVKKINELLIIVREYNNKYKYEFKEFKNEEDCENEIEKIQFEKDKEIIIQQRNQLINWINEMETFNKTIKDSKQIYENIKKVIKTIGEFNEKYKQFEIKINENYKFMIELYEFLESKEYKYVNDIYLKLKTTEYETLLEKEDQEFRNKEFKEFQKNIKFENNIFNDIIEKINEYMIKVNDLKKKQEEINQIIQSRLLILKNDVRIDVAKVLEEFEEFEKLDYKLSYEQYTRYITLLENLYDDYRNKLFNKLKDVKLSVNKLIIVEKMDGYMKRRIECMKKRMKCEYKDEIKDEYFDIYGVNYDKYDRFLLKKLEILTEEEIKEYKLKKDKEKAEKEAMISQTERETDELKLQTQKDKLLSENLNQQTKELKDEHNTEKKILKEEIKQEEIKHQQEMRKLEEKKTQIEDKQQKEISQKEKEIDSMKINKWEKIIAFTQNSEMDREIYLTQLEELLKEKNISFESYLEILKDSDDKTLLPKQIYENIIEKTNKIYLDKIKKILLKIYQGNVNIDDIIFNQYYKELENHETNMIKIKTIINDNNKTLKTIDEISMSFNGELNKVKEQYKIKNILLRKKLEIDTDISNLISHIKSKLNKYTENYDMTYDKNYIKNINEDLWAIYTINDLYSYYIKEESYLISYSSEYSNRYNYIQNNDGLMFNIKNNIEKELKHQEVIKDLKINIEFSDIDDHAFAEQKGTPSRGGSYKKSEIEIYTSLTIPILIKYYRWENYKKYKNINKTIEILSLLILFYLSSKEILLAYTIDTILSIILIKKYENEYLSIFPYYFLYYIVR